MRRFRGTMAGAGVMRVPRRVALLASLLMSAGSLQASSPPSSQVHVTRTGEIQSVAFSDGSIAHLNTRTRLEWSEDTERRRIVLHEGEALFEVKSDPARPFRVEAAGGEIRALGTRFNVYKKASGQVLLTVLQGRIQVQGQARDGEPGWRRRLRANQFIEYGPDGVIKDVRTSHTAADVAKWREGILELEDAPLAQVLEELQRHIDRRIVIADERLIRMKVGGAISSRNVEGALARLAKLLPLEVIERDDTLTLMYSNAGRNAAQR